MKLPTSVLLSLLPFFVSEVAAQASGTGTTTRYWDCCKPSCAWPKKANLVSGPVSTCGKDDNPLNDGGNTKSACDSGGNAYMCSGHAPWAVNETVAYGWAAVRISGQQESSWCCACYELTFTSGAVQGKKFIVQATNTGGDLGNNHFDLAVSFGHFQTASLWVQ
jgi:Glycosyl hydrolase family 45